MTSLISPSDDLLRLSRWYFLFLECFDLRRFFFSSICDEDDEDEDEDDD